MNLSYSVSRLHDTSHARTWTPFRTHDVLPPRFASSLLCDDLHQASLISLSALNTDPASCPGFTTPRIFFSHGRFCFPRSLSIFFLQILVMLSLLAHSSFAHSLPLLSSRVPSTPLVYTTPLCCRYLRTSLQRKTITWHIYAQKKFRGAHWSFGVIRACHVGLVTLRRRHRPRSGCFSLASTRRHNGPAPVKLLPSAPRCSQPLCLRAALHSRFIATFVRLLLLYKRQAEAKMRSTFVAVLTLLAAVVAQHVCPLVICYVLGGLVVLTVVCRTRRLRRRRLMLVASGSSTRSTPTPNSMCVSSRSRPPLQRSTRPTRRTLRLPLRSQRRLIRCARPLLVFGTTWWTFLLNSRAHVQTTSSPHKRSRAHTTCSTM